MAIDIADFQLGGEWLDLDIQSEGGDRSLRVKIKPLSDNEKFMIRKELTAEDVNKFSHRIMSLVIGWDLEDDGKPLECNKKNKENVMPYLVGMPLKKEKGKEKDPTMLNVGVAILTFAGDFNNFIKN